MRKLSRLDEIDISLYLIYNDIEKIMFEIKKDYKNILQSISKEEFRDYIYNRYKF